jgi:hypothetical protein
MRRRSVHRPCTSARDLRPSLVALTPAVRFIARSANADGCNLVELVGYQFVAKNVDRGHNGIKHLGYSVAPSVAGPESVTKP